MGSFRFYAIEFSMHRRINSQVVSGHRTVSKNLDHVLTTSGTEAKFPIMKQRFPLIH
jgi:hypothetical protein